MKAMADLLNKDTPTYTLGVESMDKTHEEFIDMVNDIANADKPAFISLFTKLVEHTERHFIAENELMKLTGFPATQEHYGEHMRVLNDLKAMRSQVAGGKLMMARAFINDHVPAWFNLHITTMDAALSRHLIIARKASENNTLSESTTTID